MSESFEKNSQPLLIVKRLGVAFNEVDVCRDISFDLYPGEILGIVGESGSGKSVTCRALMGLLPKNASVQGNMRFESEDYFLSNQSENASLRGSGLSMIFQDPMSALDPLMSVKKHIMLRTDNDPVPLLKKSGLSNPEVLLDRFAHQLSGGQCQRVAIACALARAPKVLIADEPTTALDVTVQKGILNELKTLAKSQGVGIIFITHDLAVINQLCSRVLVMQRGEVVESGQVTRVLTKPRNEYTKQLLASIPKPNQRGKRLGLSSAVVSESSIFRPPSNDEDTILEFQQLCVRYQGGNGSFHDALKNVDLKLHRGEILGLVGESGSGKSSLSKAAIGLAPISSGSVLLKGEKLDWKHPKMEWRRSIQYIFQDPLGALDPAARIINQVRLPLDVHKIGNAHEREERASQLLAETHLEETLYTRKPKSLSGGQRQRATIARALALQPEVLICDESISALDVSIQARVLNLLMELREKSGIAILFISHDLGVVHHLCDRVAVLRKGELVEYGETVRIFQNPTATYTQELLNAIPQLPVDANVCNEVGGML